MKVQELLVEGPFDYMKGLGQHVGQKFVDKMAEKGKQIAQPFVDAHKAGQQSSLQGDIRSLTKQKQQLMSHLIQLADQVEPQVVINLINRTFAQKQINLANKMKKEFAAAVQARNAPMATNEGLFDYLKGAGRAAGGATQNARQGINRAAGQAGQAVRGAARQVGDAVTGAAGQVGRSAKQAGQAVGGAVRDIHQQGQQASLTADLQKTIQQLGQTMLKLYSLQKGVTQTPTRPSRYS